MPPCYAIIQCVQICCCSTQTGTVVKPHTQTATPPTHTHKIYVFPARHPHPWRLRTPDYAIERIIHHYGVPEVVSSSCLFSTMGYFHTGASHLAFLQDIFTFSGNIRSVVGVLHSKSDYQPKQDKFSMCERELRSS